MLALTFNHALTPDGIIEDCRIEIDAGGHIASVGQGGPPYDGAFALPGMPNAHSHAFQRALVGYGEQRTGEDSFWSWREAMYALAAGMTPERYHAIARRAYTEMLAAGFTAVCEFHYLHVGAAPSRRDSAPSRRESIDMANAIIAAAHETGIRLRLLPVYYHSGGFDHPAGPVQQRFVHDSVDAYLTLLDDIDYPHLGIAAHSLRAVSPGHLRELAGAARHPLHIHVSEQVQEVEQCLAVHGKRPVHLLAETVELNPHWSLVHATHADEDERRLILEAGATVVLCPLTEAYLGDGLFAAEAFHRAGGQYAVGSDSNVRIDAIEELRWLEYGQRLHDRARARLSDENGIGAALWQHAAQAGARACGFEAGAIRVGAFADFVVLDEKAAPFAELEPARWPDAWLTGGSRHDIACTYVGGEIVGAARALSRRGIDDE